MYCGRGGVGQYYHEIKIIDFVTTEHAEILITHTHTHAPGGELRLPRKSYREYKQILLLCDV